MDKGCGKTEEERKLEWSHDGETVGRSCILLQQRFIIIGVEACVESRHVQDTQKLTPMMTINLCIFDK